MQLLDPIPLDILIPKNSANSYFYQNGLSRVIPRLTLKVNSDIETCYELWTQFSNNETFFDLWDVRYAWFKGYEIDPLFYTLYEGDKPLTVLPIWHDPIEKRYEWFGSWWMEDNRIFTRDERFFDLVFEVAPKPIFLNSIKLPHKNNNDNYNRYLGLLQADDPKNIKDINSFKSPDDYLATLQKKHRYNLKADYKRIQQLNPRVIITEGESERAFAALISMNKERFNGKERDRSDFYEDGGEDVIRNTIKNRGLYKTKFIEVHIEGKIAAVDLVAQYRGVYYLIVGGNKLLQYGGIGNYMLYLEIEDAIRDRSSQIDCFQIDYGWKHRYFDQTPAYKFVR